MPWQALRFGLRRFHCAPRIAITGLIKLFARLAVEVFAVHDEDAFNDVGVVFEESRGIEGGERLADVGGAPDGAVAAVVVNALHDVFHLIDLIRAHHEELLFAGDDRANSER